MCLKKHKNGEYQLSLGVTPTGKTPTFHIFKKNICFTKSHICGDTLLQNLKL